MVSESDLRQDGGADRRDAVLRSALTTFARFGYRKTSMDEIARVARISRPGLYFLFASKAELFRAAATHVLQEDLTEVERILGESRSPLRGRLIEAFDQWAGRYIGPHSNDIAVVIETNPDLLGGLTLEAPARFSALITAAVQAGLPNLEPQRGAAVAQTLISVSVGIKYQVDDRGTYLDRFATAVDLLLR